MKTSHRMLTLFIFVCVFVFQGVPAVTATAVTFNFDITQNISSQYPGLIHADSVVFHISTSQNALCRYSSTKGTPFNSMQGNFEDNLEIVHKKTFADLSDGVYRYYVRCREIGQINNLSQGLSELEAVFRINNPIAAEISLEETTLDSGKYEVKLTTTKTPISVPKLSYTYDDSSYKRIVLHGSGKEYEGTLIIPDSALEAVGRFRFEARDLENRLGTKITGDKSFEVDTKEPTSPQLLEAKGEYSQIRLEWYSKEKDAEKIRVYRTQDPPVKLTSLYKTIDNDQDYFIDRDVDSAETYYYRVAFEDAAGNLGELSSEVTATTLLRNTSSRSTALSPQLVGLVDALITEVDVFQTEVERAKEEFDLQSSEQKAYLDLLGITDTTTSANAGIEALYREVESFKLQDLKREVLNSKITSARSRINILKKGIPNTVSVLDEIETSQKISQESIRTAILQSSPEALPETIDASTQNSFEQAEQFSVQTKATVLEVIYLDGSSRSDTIIEHELKETANLQEGTKFFLQLPQGVLRDARLKISNADYTEEKDDLFSFKKDTEKITYRLDKKVSQETIEEIDVSPVIITPKESFLTGYFLSELPSPGSVGTTALLIIAGSLGLYLLYVRRRSTSDSVQDFIAKARKVKELKRQGRINESNELYVELKAEYLSLSSEEKSKVFKEVKHLMGKQ